MPTATIDIDPAPRSANYRRLCAWCGRDLGAFDYLSQHHTYGICETCAYQYFAYLYDTEAAPLPPGKLNSGSLVPVDAR